MSYNAPGSSGGPLGALPVGETPLVVIFERDDAIAVPLLTQLRMAAYDVRSARTPVELFDILQKLTVALILVDLGNATASRREFWVALDAHRRGRNTQVLTFRQVGPTGPFHSEIEVSPMALADVEIGGPQDLPLLVAAVCQRVPLASGPLAGPGNAGVGDVNHMAGLAPLGPFGPVLGMAMRPGGPQALGNGAAFGTPGMSPGFNPGAPGAPYAPPGAPSAFGSHAPSPFAHPSVENPFTQAAGASPFAQPDSGNPFAAVVRDAPSSPPQADFADRPRRSGSTGGLAATRLQPLGTPAREPASPFDVGTPAVPSPFNGHDGWTPAPPLARDYRRDETPPGMRAVTDAWVPPDGAVIDDEPFASAHPAPYDPPASAPPRQAGMEWPTQPVVVPADSDFPTYDTHQPHDAQHAPGAAVAPQTLDGDALNVAPDRGYDVAGRHVTSTEPAYEQPARDTMSTTLVPGSSSALILPEERALGAVLVEGALLTPRKLEVLKGIKSMLSSVEMNFKLGELALLFKFLSPDQLLAALLVSRQLVSPQQIAALGQIKQELGRSGINYDLESLLVMFHILSHEDLDRLRADLA